MNYAVFSQIDRCEAKSYGILSLCYNNSSVSLDKKACNIEGGKKLTRGEHNLFLRYRRHDSLAEWLKRLLVFIRH